MKLFEVIQPLVESQARIEKTAERYHEQLQISVNNTGTELSNWSNIIGKNYDHLPNKWSMDTIPLVMVDYFADKFDPTSNNKYLDWIVRAYINEDFSSEDYELVNGVLSMFDQHKRHLDKRDINQYKSFTELKDAVKPFSVEFGDVKQQEMIGAGKAKVIYDKGGERIIVPKTYEAARVFSHDTEWCTQYPDMFQKYTESGPLYIIESGDRKFQLHLKSEQFMDKHDRHVELENVDSNTVDWLINHLRNQIEQGKVSDPPSAALSLMSMVGLDNNADWVKHIIEKFNDSESIFETAISLLNHNMVDIEWIVSLIEKNIDRPQAPSAAFGLYLRMRWKDTEKGEWLRKVIEKNVKAYDHESERKINELFAWPVRIIARRMVRKKLVSEEWFYEVFGEEY